jgi:hypothetical protein
MKTDQTEEQLLEGFEHVPDEGLTSAAYEAAGLEPSSDTGSTTPSPEAEP